MSALEELLGIRHAQQRASGALGPRGPFVPVDGQYVGLDSPSTLGSALHALLAGRPDGVPPSAQRELHSNGSLEWNWMPPGLGAQGAAGPQTPTYSRPPAVPFPHPSDLGFRWGSIMSEPTEDSPNPVEIALNHQTRLDRLSARQRRQVAEQFLHEIARQHPALLRGVKVHWTTDNDPTTKRVNAAWEKTYGHPIMAAGYGSPDRQVWFNTDQLKGTTAEGLRFLLAKELGQANERDYINTDDKRRAYEDYLGSATPSGYAEQPIMRQDSFGGTERTSAVDWYGNDFATALGYNPNPREAFGPLDALVGDGILPRQRFDPRAGSHLVRR